MANDGPPRGEVERVAHVFISYAREDRDRAEAIAAILERWGWDAWWDRDLIAGESFGRRLEEQIESAAAVVVVWSRDAVDSDWVRAEASVGAERKVLVPVALDRVKVPMRFRLLHTIQLVDWDGDDDDPRLDELYRGIVAKTGVVPVEGGDQAVDVSPGLLDRWAARLTRWISAPYLTWLGVGVATGLAIVAAAVVALVLWGGANDGDDVPDDEFPLSEGSIGPRVGAVQGWLADIGHDVGPDAAESRWGDATTAAVAAWQGDPGADDVELDRDGYHALHLSADPDFVPRAVTGCEAQTVDDADACEGELVRAPGDLAVYLVVEGERARVPDQATLRCFGTNEDVRIIPASVVDSYPLVDPLTCES